ncbi:DNA-3-methyladenine glycosylase 2 family protein [Paenibacillus sp. VCA1]|uniref:DNA-3-methyladenine glycosylase family protein n=1 Tax=Paenibacillus sp. VCA1 TaxID=3039148 RepID=UPI002871F6DA|nr:DNA-3-methyladenine glycosylase 2 family protein [Paenibacillus sp. VCA1]MDR9854890.1 DNA-3-methyladenine glycosylase 2 family protein [Paenibacillus sp. VCA1]
MLSESTTFFQYGEIEMTALRGADPVFGAAMDRIGFLKRPTTPDLFKALAQAVVGQLISVKAAQSVWERMVARFGRIDPPSIAAQSPEELRACGLTMKKAACIYRTACRMESGELDLDELALLPDTEVVRRLTSLDGIGVWTAEMLLLHALERPDVVSWGDVAIRRGMMKLYGLDGLTKKEFDRYRELYSPYGSVASIYLWEISYE